ncbi:MAG: energy transducer TonB [Rhodobacter sp.]|nr:energy transducer TonB [Rhodobacter sp.]
MDGSGMICVRRLDREAVFAPQSPLAPAVAGRTRGAPVTGIKRRRRKLPMALGLSAALHAAAALAITVAAEIGGTEAAGDGGTALQSLPPAMAVEILTPADLVSDTPPEIAVMAPDFAEPSVWEDQNWSAPAAFAAPVVPMAAMTTIMAPTVDQGAVVALAVPPVPEARPEPEPRTKPAAKAKPKKPTAKAADAGGTAARGSGGKVAAGDGGAAKAAGPTKAQIADLKAEWGGKVRAKVERRRAYPSAAKGAAGTVKVRITLAASGKLVGVSVAASSGNAALDAAAVKAVQAAGKFPAAPKGLADATYSFTLPMTFKP